MYNVHWTHSLHCFEFVELTLRIAICDPIEEPLKIPRPTPEAETQTKSLEENETIVSRSSMHR